jgi:hypothetical protein
MLLGFVQQMSTSQGAPASAAKTACRRRLGIVRTKFSIHQRLVPLPSFAFALTLVVFSNLFRKRYFIDFNVLKKICVIEDHSHLLK